MIQALDGFDELLQATGVSQSDYLEKVREFQVREEELGRPVAVVVTSRTIVADRVRYPRACPIIRIEPFSHTQMQSWVDIWNQTNSTFYEMRGSRFSPAAAARSHPELVCQPLLLLMLALYDADADDLARKAASLERGEIYEQILTRFVRREVLKADPKQDATQSVASAERELTRLSIAAFAMLNRGRQSVTEDALNSDLKALGLLDTPDVGTPQRTPSGAFGGRISAARRLLGRFFFIFDSTARLDGVDVSAYEFLHPTFGEFLIARFAMRSVSDLLARVRSARSASLTFPESSLDDGLLFSLLSFSPLSSRVPILEFLQEQARMTASPDREDIRKLLVGLMSARLQERPRSFASYEPAATPSPHRYSTYLANLLLLMLSMTDVLELKYLYPGERDPKDQFRRLLHLCKSQFSPESWRGFADSLQMAAGNDDVRLRRRAEPMIIHVGEHPIELDTMKPATANQLRDLLLLGGLDDLDAVGALASMMIRAMDVASSSADQRPPRSGRRRKR